MASALKDLSWVEIEAVCDRLRPALETAASVERAAAELAATFLRFSETCLLARVFLVVPWSKLPPADRDWASELARKLGRTVSPTTPILALAGTAGKQARWNERTASEGHRAIPLFDRAFIDGAPMIAALLGALRIDFEPSTEGAMQLRAMPGGLNARFLVEDGATSTDAEGRHIIAQDFAASFGIRSVFGMGGSYVGGDHAIAVIFTTEALAARDVDRFTNLISVFKMATSERIRTGKLFG
ncbi:hypothetical protein BH11MYX1_BH11MYX1_14590 [soil metagenome]